MTEFPRILSANQRYDARLVCKILPGIDAYKPDRGPIHWSTGPYWPEKMREYADELEEAIHALRRMADFLDANQPDPDTPRSSELGS